MSGAIVTAERTDWRTPERVLRVVREFWPEGIALDPCAHPDRQYWFARESICPPRDGLSVDWAGTTYVNPPYGRLIEPWVRKAMKIGIASDTTEVILLHPSFTSRKLWHEMMVVANAACFVRGRLSFDGQDVGAWFSSQLTYFGYRPRLFAKSFRQLGTVWLCDRSSQIELADERHAGRAG